MNRMDVRLRNIREEDLEKIRNWRMQPSVTKYMFTDPQITPADQQAWFQKICASEACKYWIITADGVDIGLLGIIDIDPANRRCSWIWYIGEESFRGKGVAKRIQLNLYDYVFCTLKMNRLYSNILTFNTHEIENVHVKCGYQLEGVMKDHVYKNGEYYDVTVMGITADHWAEIKDQFQYEAVEFESQ